MNNEFPIIIIGAGPVGLAAAAHLHIKGKAFLLFEMGSTVGSSIKEWAHIKMFSSWALNIDPIAVKLLESTDWISPNLKEFPTGLELTNNYLVPLSNIPKIKKQLFLKHKVDYVTRFNKGKSQNRTVNLPFEVILTDNNEKQKTVYASGIIDASGTWKTPNPVGGTGYPAKGELECNKIFYGIPDVLGKHKERFANKNTIVVGGGLSAVNVLLDLIKLKDESQKGVITWVTRSSREQVKNQASQLRILPERAVLTEDISTHIANKNLRIIDGFSTREISPLNSDSILVKGLRNGNSSIIECNEIIACTGARPDLNLTKELQLNIDAIYECPIGVSKLILQAKDKGEMVPEPHGFLSLQHTESNYFTIGMKSHGRAPNFFLMSGYEQVRSICSYLTGDIDAAKNIMFSYPEDGICGESCGDGACCSPVSLTSKSNPEGCGLSDCCG